MANTSWKNNNTLISLREGKSLTEEEKKDNDIFNEICTFSIDNGGVWNHKPPKDILDKINYLQDKYDILIGNYRNRAVFTSKINGREIKADGENYSYGHKWKVDWVSKIKKLHTLPQTSQRTKFWRGLIDEYPNN